MSLPTESELHPPPSEDNAAPTPAPHHHILPHHRPHTLLQSFQSLVTLIVIALFIITFSMQPFRIPSQSMEPTLLVGDFLLVNKEVSRDSWMVAPTSQIHRGDLIVFHYPVDPSMHLVKRVIGLPGEHVRLHAGRAYINGHPLPEPYAVFEPAAPDLYRDEFPRMDSADPNIDSRWWIQLRTLIGDGEIVVPSDSFFVLGDNRNDSADSRYWGFVPRAAIVGKPFLIYFSVRVAEDAPSDSLRAPAARTEPHTGFSLGSARWDRAMHVIR